MAATYTYPGVYVEEIPSGVRTITGVSTATAAFVDYFDRGETDVAIRLFNRGDLERYLGGLHPASEASYGLQQYFLNGGSEAYAVRVLLAPEAGDLDDDGTPFTAISPASVTLPDDVGVGDSITITAKSPGAWGNRLVVGVIHPDPADNLRFGLTVREYDGEVLIASENYDDVNSTDGDAANVATVVNGGSALVTVEVETPGTRPPSADQVAQANLTALQTARPAAVAAVAGAEADVLARRNELPPLEAAVQAAIDAFVTPLIAAEEAALNVAQGDSENAIRNVLDNNATVVADRATRDAAEVAMQAEVDGFIAADPPTNQPLIDDALATSQQVVDATVAAGTAEPSEEEILQNELDALRGEAVAGVIGSPTADTAAADLRAATDALALTLAAARANAELDSAVSGARLVEAAAAAALTAAEATASSDAEADANVVAARTAVSDKEAEIAAAEAAVLGAQAALSALDQQIRVAERATDIDELDDLGQAILTALINGSDGVRPGSNVWKARASSAIVGTQNNSSGIYALDQITPQIFNIMCIPAAAELDEAATSTVYVDALAYCERKRAFLLVDPPRDLNDIDSVLGWGDLPRNKNAALYFPRLTINDPLASNAPREVASSGTVAGVFARTDANRGVFKAPAGTAANLRGAGLRLTYVLTDKENGVLNPQGVNALRNFPIYNNIAWGARTLRGANAMASEWKYVPVRRTALYIEESLFQGLKWVVFEPNDAPLWGQIRLAAGTFMHGLFRQGAFQGTKPADAYLVKCDSETTTQADIDAGIVNIVVAFAPLKPAEFVVIKIKQLAGQTQA